MKFNDDILKLLQKTYEPSATTGLRYKTIDMVFKTDDEGRPVLLFMGKKDEKGNIKGERYARVLRFAPDGSIIKDHWDHKGKAS